MTIRLTSKAIHLHFKIKQIKKQKQQKSDLYLMRINQQNKVSLKIL